MTPTPGTLHVLIGPVGAGKTTYGHQQAARTRGLVLDLDTWMVRLFGDDPRPSKDVLAWYLARRDRCRALMWDLTVDTLRCGIDVWLELGLLQHSARHALYTHARAEDLTLRVHLLDAPRAVRRARVLARNTSDRPFVQVVPPAFFERASDAWEEPTERERRDWDIHVV